MRKIILDLATTLDGFIEGPNGEIDWCILDDDMDLAGFLSGIDLIFYGRVSYEQWGNFQPGPDAPQAEQSLWQAVHSKKKYVFSHRDQKDKNAQYISGDIVKKVNEIRSTPGKDIWLYGGAGLIRTFIAHDLVDVFRLSVHPTVLGSGKPLFEDLKERLSLSLKEVNRFRSGVVQLVYFR